MPQLIAQKYCTKIHVERKNSSDLTLCSAKVNLNMRDAVIFNTEAGFINLTHYGYCMHTLTYVFDQVIQVVHSSSDCI